MPENLTIASHRYRFVDAMRGLAIVLMVINHTARYWLPGGYDLLIYFSMAFSGPLFLFLVGFSLAISYRQKSEIERLKDSRTIKKYIYRAGWLFAGGCLLYLAVYGPAEMFRGRVLQAIAWSIILALPWLRLSRSRGGRIFGYIFSLAWLFSLPLVFTPLQTWLAGHSVLTYLFFSNFPPLYYFALPLLGLMLGRSFLETEKKPSAKRLYFFSLIIIALLAAAIGLAAVWPYLFSGGAIFFLDFNLNGYWLPRPLSLLLILGYIGLTIAGSYYFWEVKKINSRVLEILGRASLMIYCLHLLLIYDLIRLMMGFRASSLIDYAFLTGLLLMVLYIIAKHWPEIKNNITNKMLFWKRDLKDAK